MPRAMHDIRDVPENTLKNPEEMQENEGLKEKKRDLESCLQHHFTGRGGDLKRLQALVALKVPLHSLCGHTDRGGNRAQRPMGR